MQSMLKRSAFACEFSLENLHAFHCHAAFVYRCPQTILCALRCFNVEVI